MNKPKIFLLTHLILLCTLCGYGTTNRWVPAVATVLRANASPTAANTVNYTVTFTEPVTGVTTGSFSVATFLGLTGASVTSVSGSGTTWTVTVNTGTGDGNLRLLVTGAGINPAVRNLPYSGGALYSVDKTAPVGTVTINNGAVYTNNTTVSLAITGSEPGVVMRFSTDNFTWSAYEASAATKSFTLTPGDGAKTVYMQLMDQAGNTGTFSDGITLDQVPPAVSSVGGTANGYYKEGDYLNFVVNYTEMVTLVNTGGNPYLVVDIGGNSVYALYDAAGSTSSSTMFRYQIVSGDMDMNGISLSGPMVLNGATITDRAGNNVDPSLQGVPSLAGVFVNTTNPTAVLSASAVPDVNGAFTITITFSEAVTGLSVGDFDGVNATFSSLQTSDNITYTMLATPGTPGVKSIYLPAGTVLNIAGNANTISNTLSYQQDNTAPDITSVTKPATGNYHLYSPLVFTVTYNEHVIVTGTPHIAIQIGDPIDRIASYIGGSGTSTLTFSYASVEEGLLANDITISPAIALNGGSIMDAAGNNADLLLQNISPSIVNVDSRRPTVVLTTTAPGTVSAPFPVTLTFSEAVTGFVLSDVNYLNVTSLSDLQTTDNITHTFTVTPAANGSVEVQLTSDKAYNVRLNGNASSNLLRLNYDNIPPVVTSVGVPAPKYYKTGEVLDFSVALNENVSVAGVPYIDLFIGAAQVKAEYVSGGANALTFRYTIIDGDIDEDGVVLGTSLVFNGGSIKDVAGNDVVPTLNSVGNTTGVYIYSQVPAITLTTTAGALVNAPFTIQIQFSDVPNSFDQSNITVTNASVSFLSIGVASYTLQVTPLAEGPVTISVPANAVVNKAGTGNTASNTISVIYDGTAPVITSVNVPANGYYKANSTLAFTVNTSEVIEGSGIPSLDVIIGAATRQATYVSGLGTNALAFSYVVQDGEMDMDGISLGANLITNGATLKDAAGNNMVYTLQHVGNTQNVFVNTSHPSVVLSSIAAASVNAPYAITITFSEAVTGFAASDLTVTNGAAANLQTTDNITYTAVITPTADGAVTIQLPADRAENIGANGNTASNMLTTTYDGTAPVISAGQTFNVKESDAVGTVAGTVTATEATGTLQNWTIAADPSGGAFAISTNGTITVKDVALLNSKVGTTITLSVIVSDGMNTSAPTAVAIVIKAINKAPAFDPVADKELCITTATQTFNVTGATATEAGQTFDFTISADQPLFDALAIDAAGVVSYKLKATATGKTNITVIIKDNGGTENGGVDVYQRTFALNVNSLPVVNITSNKGTTVSKGDAVVLTASGAATYNWGTATGAVFTVTPQANTTYNVTGVSTAGCPGTAQIAINIIEDFKVDAINILTPNGDGINDRWVIRNINSYPNNELKIFDRSGRIVYQRRNYSNDWDGTMNGRRLAEGTYYYILTIEGSNKAVKGYITLISDQK